MQDEDLYRRYFLGPLLRCVDVVDANYLIREVHEGICGLHAGSIMVVAKLMNASLTYGTEAMTSAEIGVPSARILMINDRDKELRMNLYLLEERRELALIREHNCKRQLQKYYDSRVQKCTFDAEDFVFRNNEASGQEPPGKLGPTWEGPYKVKGVLSKGAYKLEKLDGTKIPRTWNMAQLKECYI
ncbi:uncharacterized protein LOC143589082 [Bidens hawaiensis]|uniref:uncharacterized protein LOC143589082 n=1 Tax=Bidens hawaiensis TaxID=980011 RepID=UPI00404A4BC2